VVTDPGWFFRIGTADHAHRRHDVSDVAGEQITSRGIGSGISLIILAGIVAELPSAIVGTLELGRRGALDRAHRPDLVMAVAVIAFILLGTGAASALIPVSQASGRQPRSRPVSICRSSSAPGCDPADLCIFACCCRRRLPISAPGRDRIGSSDHHSWATDARCS
jgi:hypothetical protein